MLGPAIGIRPGVNGPAIVIRECRKCQHGGAVHAACNRLVPHQAGVAARVERCLKTHLCRN